MAEGWTPESLSEVVRGFHGACVVIAGAELDVFTILHATPLDAARLATRLNADSRAMAVLLDALAALGLLTKGGGVYRVPDEVARMLAEAGDQSTLGMTRHMGNCLRRWARLAEVVLSGRPIEDEVSVRGGQEDLASFIRAMHEVSTPMAVPLVESLGPLRFNHLLDLAGGSGTWTIPLLRRNPAATATIFDLPEVIPMAETRMRDIGLSGRVRLVAGDYNRDDLPGGHDLAWVSAIVHQNSREQNRALFRKVCAALVPGGRILIRDIVMEESRTAPAMGALFAVNMLVATPGGGTFTFEELRQDLQASGFRDVAFLRRGEAMDSVVEATR
jgi:ubiquinone/menaquinone biosynthesis C-methylase UbiE